MSDSAKRARAKPRPDPTDRPPYATATQLARRHGVTIRALHSYEEQGLVRPSRNRRNHRRYDPIDQGRVALIAPLRQARVPVAEIRELLHLRDHGGSTGRATVERRVAACLMRLTEELRTVDAVIAGLRARAAGGERADVAELRH